MAEVEDVVRLVRKVTAADLVRNARLHLAESCHALALAHRRLDPTSRRALEVDALRESIEALHTAASATHQRMTEGTDAQ